MLSEFFFSLVLVIVWAVVALVGVLLPSLGIAWVITRLTALTLAEACLFVFVHIGTLAHILQTCLALRWLDLWRPVLWLSIFSLAVATLEGLWLHNLTDLTMFQATLVTSGANLLLAYGVVHSALGSVPPFLRDTFFKHAADDLEEEDFTTPPFKPRRRRRW